jgi:hypothetical protein
MEDVYRCKTTAGKRYTDVKQLHGRCIQPKHVGGYVNKVQ